ncbi:hypothetical protein BC938DRAFT_477808 [Jimgerdemannia flammicorona]|uniref:Uncharacterized protein n=1 Tax=Jimgerdemannia flammicorona TaxID=994334 RepID=A0A433QNT2_9FUNG|nr:hypothetical protein BC938DRAFT_477808 [Jimgerdemannia flammicorona]
MCSSRSACRSSRNSSNWQNPSHCAKHRNKSILPQDFANTSSWFMPSFLNLLSASMVCTEWLLRTLHQLGML